jgi:SAM-dependent methyltransferase
MTHSDRGYRQIVAHYEDCLTSHGDNHRGVDWPHALEAERRYQVMLELIPSRTLRPIRLLDFGCGAGHLLEYIRRKDLARIEYHGLDLSPLFVSLCQQKFPHVPFTRADILEEGVDLPKFDFIVLNGVLTEKRSLSNQSMWLYAKALLRRLWPHARHGLSFNVMSKKVDCERSDLFHLSTDQALEFLASEISRHCVFRHDYGLYEYTVYVYREANRWPE